MGGKIKDNGGAEPLITWWTSYLRSYSLMGNRTSRLSALWETRPSQKEESAQPDCGGSECLAQPHGVQQSSLNPGAQPWLSAARRGATLYVDAVSDPAAGDSVGLVQVARRRYRKRGCRGHGALERRKRSRPRLVAAVGTGQRVGTRRGGSESRLCDILVAIQAQGTAIEALAASVGRLAGSVHAQQRRREDSPPQRESGMESQPDEQVVGYISQQLVQVQCSAQQTADAQKQTADAQRQSEQRLNECVAELRAIRNELLGHSTARQQLEKQLESQYSQLDALQQTVGAIKLRARDAVSAVGSTPPPLPVSKCADFMRFLEQNFDKEWKEEELKGIAHLWYNEHKLGHCIICNPSFRQKV